MGAKELEELRDELEGLDGRMELDDTLDGLDELDGLIDELEGLIDELEDQPIDERALDTMQLPVDEGDNCFVTELVPPLPSSTYNVNE